MKKYINIMNKKFGRLLVVEDTQESKKGNKIWLCKCDCGKTIKVMSISLRNGNTQSCGCLKKEKIKKSNTKHNKSKTSEYYAWSNMIQRCSNPKNKEYKNYGGRGILVSNEWKNDFNKFLKDMGEKPNKNLSLDRIDNNKGYCKENCRWTDSYEQSINQRMKKTNKLKIKNISYSERDNLYYVDITRRKNRYRKSFKKLENAIDWKQNILDSLK